MRNREHQIRPGRRRPRLWRTLDDLCADVRMRRAFEEAGVPTEDEDYIAEENAPVEKEPFWDIWRDGVNHDLLAAFMRCRETCRLMFMEGWTSRLLSQAHEFQHALRWTLSKARASGTIPIQELTKRYERLLLKHAPEAPVDELTKLQRVVRLVPIVLATCLSRWPHDPANEWLTVNPGKPVPWTFSDDRQAKIRARVTAFNDIEEGGWWVEETYCGVRLDGDRFKAETRFNLRTLLALYVWREATGKQPAGVVYNLINGPAPFLPQRADQLGYFCDEIMKRPQRHLQRVKVLVPRQTLDGMVQGFLGPLMNDVRVWAEGKENHYPNVCDDPYGRYNKGAPMYQAIVHGDFTDYYRRKTVFPPTLVLA